MGLFAEYQPIYAEHGLPTFPVDGTEKRPAVRSYARMGLPASRQLAMRFTDSDRFGLMAGRKNGLTILDIDTPDEKVWAQQFAKYGEPKLVVRTGSGNCQAWYRHNGERRRIRRDPKVPVDILGDGYAVAPPSMGANGQYQIIVGSLDDLGSLRPMLPANDAEPFQSKSAQLQAAIASERQVHQQIAAPVIPTAAPIGQGCRNTTLFNVCLSEARRVGGLEELIAFARGWNASCIPPLPDPEVINVAGSAWGYQERNMNLKGGGKIVVAFGAVDGLISDPHALALHTFLKRHHAGLRETFAISPKALAPSIGWNPKRLRQARDALVAGGYLVRTNKGGRGLHDAATFTWGA